MIPADPQISVIVPVHNVQAHIGACIASLRKQRFCDFEAIVIDDGSTDASPDRLRAAIGDDHRFEVIRQENRGLSAARNVGLNKAKGAFIAFLDGDDRYAPEFLERLYRALCDSDADWVACGLRNVHPGLRRSDTHSAIHDAPELPANRAPRLWPLSTWGEAIAHFPSAWNKLYRRRLIEGLRFDEGTWFEDHAFFLRAAARSDALLHLPEPLYLQTRGRAGQITATDGDQVFEQFAVLDTLADLLAGPEKPGGPAALECLAHRLVHERSTALRDPERRARFLATARDWLARRGLPAVPGPDLPRGWARELAGSCPLSVIVPWDGREFMLRATLKSLTRQTLGGFETLIVAGDAGTARHGADLAHRMGLPGARGLTAKDSGAGSKRDAGLAAARGELVVFSDPGDWLRPAALTRWVDMMLREDADFGLSQFRVGLNRIGRVRQGFHGHSPVPTETGPLQFDVDRALALQCQPGAKIYRRSFLLARGLRFGTGPLADWQIGIGAALAARKAVYCAWPGVEILCLRRFRASILTEPAVLPALKALVAVWSDTLPQELPKDILIRLYARAVWEFRTPFLRFPGARIRFLSHAARTVRKRGWHQSGTPLDPFLSLTVRWIMAGARGCIAPVRRAQHRN